MIKACIRKILERVNPMPQACYILWLFSRLGGTQRKFEGQVRIARAAPKLQVGVYSHRIPGWFNADYRLIWRDVYHLMQIKPFPVSDDAFIWFLVGQYDQSNIYRLLRSVRYAEGNLPRPGSRRYARPDA